VRSCAQLIEAFALHLASLLTEAQKCPYQALDSSAMPVRDAKRRGEGWLAGCADIGWSNSLGWYEGFRLLVATDPTGVVTGFGFLCRFHRRPAGGRDLLRRAASSQPSAAERRIGLLFGSLRGLLKGFEGEENHRRWLDRYGVRIKIVESVYDKLFNAFGLWRERAHELEGLRARLAARVELHNFCIWLNDHLGRPRLAFADLLGW
jgi:hypothetical protein